MESTPHSDLSLAFYKITQNDIDGLTPLISDHLSFFNVCYNISSLSFYCAGNYTTCICSGWDSVETLSRHDVNAGLMNGVKCLGILLRDLLRG